MKLKFLMNRGSNDLHTENINESFGTIESLRQQAHKNSQQIRMRKKSMILNQARRIYPTEKFRSWDKNLNASDLCHTNTSISLSSSTSSESSMSPGAVKFSKKRRDERLMPYKLFKPHQVLPNCVHKSNASLLNKNNSHALSAQSQCQQKKLSGAYPKVKSVPSLVEPMSLPYSSYEYLLPFYLSLFSPMNQNHITQQIKSIKQKQYDEQSIQQEQESQKQQQHKQSRHMQQQHQNQFNYMQQHDKQQRYQQQQQNFYQLQRNKQTISNPVNAEVKSEQEKVDEHFKRSLGVIYVKLFQDHSIDTNYTDKNNRDVDEHFAKALGAETWKQLKQAYESNCQNSSSMPLNKKQSTKLSYFKT